METVIVMCLLVIIALLLQEKIVIKKRKIQKPPKEKTNPDLPDVMGRPKTAGSLSVPKQASERHRKKKRRKTNNFDIETGSNADVPIPQEEQDDAFGNTPDWEEEEEEWNGYGISGGNNGFAQGVTFEELSAVGMLLEKEKLEPSQKETAIAIVQKIQGTELFSLLENSMESASRKIAELLDASLSSERDSSSSNLRKSDLGNFDIGDFV